MPTERAFYFSSIEHPGCRIYARPFTVDNIVVTANRSYDYLRYMDDPFGKIVATEERKIYGKTEISGTLHGVTTHTDFTDDKPFEIEICTYSPVDNADYKTKILGAMVVEAQEQTIQFVAQTLIPWKVGTHPDVEKLSKCINILYAAVRWADTDHMQLGDPLPYYPGMGTGLLNLPWSSAEAAKGWIQRAREILAEERNDMVAAKDGDE